MAFAAFLNHAVLIFLKAAGAERHGMVKFHPRADLSRFANHHAGAMVDEKMRSDLGAWMNVDPGAAVGPFSHDAWD